MVDQTKVLRDEKSGAVISTELTALQEYKKRKQMQRQTTDKIERLEKRVDALEKILFDRNN